MPAPYKPELGLPEEWQLIVVHDPERKGKGQALQEGFRSATGERIVWFDDGGEIDPQEIQKALQHDADIIVAAKLHPKSVYRCCLLRLALTWISAATTRILFNLPLRDTQTGLKVFKRQVLDYPWKVTGFGHDIEVLAKSYHRGYTIIEIPVTIHKKNKSTVSFAHCVKTLWEMLKIRAAI